MQFLVDADLVQSIDERDPIISLNSVDLSGANVSDANLRNADLNGADLRDANLSDSDLSVADLANADLSFADLSFTDLSDAYLSGASLIDVDLRGAILRDANLSVAILRGADLRDAYLRGVDLSYVDLSNAYLSDASLRDASLIDVDRRDLRRAMVDGAADEAIFTVRQCSGADASGGPLEEGIYEIMLQMPEEIQLGETERAGLLVSPLTKDEVSESDNGCVKLTDRMEARIYSDDLEKLVISPQRDNVQELSSNRVTRWGWDITARQTGKLKLAIALSPEGQEFRFAPKSPVYTGTIKVTTEQSSP